jgi:uncharacterized protein with GYD domain
MPTFATLVRFSAQEITSYANPRMALEEGVKLAVERGIKPIGSYATLGPYDVMLIYEAKDEKVAANLAMDFGLKWGGRGETWTLIPVKELRKLAKKRPVKA